jgi:hypothetical protein
MSARRKPMSLCDRNDDEKERKGEYGEQKHNECSCTICAGAN